MEAGETVGQYLLQRKLAVGGMAEIWLATTQGPAGFRKDVVIKRILPEHASDETFVEMFLDEARLAASLNHPNIVTIFNLGRDRDSYFIAMEYIEGYDLSRVIARARTRGTKLPAPIAARIVADACAGLDYAHNFADAEGNRVGLVHRDISPHNLIISRAGVVKLVDFGVAKAASSVHKTQTGLVKGKLAYLSPEQIHAKPLDGRSDIFAMGIVLYELLTGERPFGGESELLAVSAILNDAHSPVAKHREGLQEGLEEIVSRALSKRPQDRYQSAAEMERDLEQWMRQHQATVSQRDLSDFLASLFSERAAAPSGGAATVLGEVEAVRPTTMENTANEGWAAAVAAPAPQASFARTEVALGDGLEMELAASTALHSPDIRAVSHAAHAVTSPEGTPAEGAPRKQWPRAAMVVAALAALAASLWVFGSDAPEPVAPPSLSPEPAVAVAPQPAPQPTEANAAMGEASGSAATPNEGSAPNVAAAPAPVQPPAEKPAPEAKEPPPRVHVREVRGQANIRIIYPGTAGSYKVSIDGKPVGESPKALFPVSAGSHTVEVKFYGKKFSKTVRLAPGTSTSIRPTF